MTSSLLPLTSLDNGTIVQRVNNGLSEENASREQWRLARRPRSRQAQSQRAVWQAAWQEMVA